MTRSLCYTHEALTSLAPHERLPEILVVWLPSSVRSVQLLNRVRLCDPIDCSTRGLPSITHSRSLLTISFSIMHFQFSSVTQSCLTLCNPMNRSTPGVPVHHQLPEFTQTHVHRVSDAIHAEPRPRGCSGLGEPRPALPSF